METKMSIKTLINSTALAAALTLGAAHANAETVFSTLAGLQAEPMHTAAMEAQGRLFIDPPSGNLVDPFGQIFAYDPATGSYFDENGNAWSLSFGTQYLADGSVVDVFGNLVGNWSPGGASIVLAGGRRP
jgi:hypothetical protein